jgi:hypothetical protein
MAVTASKVAEVGRLMFIHAFDCTGRGRNGKVRVRTLTTIVLHHIYAHHIYVYQIHVYTLGSSTTLLCFSCKRATSQTTSWHWLMTCQ